MKEEPRKWIRKADKDLSTAGFALQTVDGPLPVTTALHCQLAAENYLKAFLSEQGIPFLDSYRLSSLFEACKPVDNSFDGLLPVIEQLHRYSIASSYPKSGDSLGFREEAIASTKRVRDFVLGKLT
jgi:HEPN domain-containing protein